jgi:hypothetical protein
MDMAEKTGMMREMAIQHSSFRITFTMDEEVPITKDIEGYIDPCEGGYQVVLTSTIHNRDLHYQGEQEKGAVVPTKDDVLLLLARTLCDLFLSARKTDQSLPHYLSFFPSS